LRSQLNIVESEQKIVKLMIHIYCKNYHNCRQNLCSECEKLKDYAITRLDKCRYGNSKPTCRGCKTHCYSPVMRKKIIKVMRFSGPRMIFSHPIYAFYHITRKTRASE